MFSLQDNALINIQGLVIRNGAGGIFHNALRY